MSRFTALATSVASGVSFAFYAVLMFTLIMTDTVLHSVFFSETVTAWHESRD